MLRFHLACVNRFDLTHQILASFVLKSLVDQNESNDVVVSNSNQLPDAAVNLTRAFDKQQDVFFGFDVTSHGLGKFLFVGGKDRASHMFFHKRRTIRANVDANRR